MDLTGRAHDLILHHFAEDLEKDLGHESTFTNKDIGTDKTPEKNIALDATCGNGFDTVFLANAGFKKIFAFDVQPQAILNTQQRLTDAGYDNVTLINDSHEHLAKHLEQAVDCVVFNFGYMPNIKHGCTTNKDITTQAHTSLIALKSALSLLSKSGLISLLCYPGHPQGADETNVIQQWLSRLEPNYNVETHLARSPKANAPILYTIQHY